MLTWGYLYVPLTEIIHLQARVNIGIMVIESYAWLVSDIIYVFYAVEGCIYPTCHDGSKLNLHSIIISTTDNFLHIWSQQNGLENVS